MDRELLCDVYEIGRKFADILNGKKADDLYVMQSMENAFVACGEELNHYEESKKDSFREGLKLVFSEENLRDLYKELKGINGHKYTTFLREKLTNLCHTYEIDAPMFVEAFITIFKDCINQYDPDLYHEIYEEEQFSEVKDLIRAEKYEIGDYLKNEIGSLIKATVERENRTIPFITSNTKRTEQKHNKTEWKLTNPDVHSMLNGFKNKKQDINYLTQLWRGERQNAPEWYIFPREKRYLLCLYTRDSYLLTMADDLCLDEQFQFTYEIVWRMEKGFIAYSYNLLHSVEQVWEKVNYDSIIMQNDENLRKWFFVGQSLLREYREDLEVDKWKEVYSTLIAHDNGELNLEKAKMLFMQMRITEVRDYLQSFDNEGLNYGARLEIAGLKAECGLLEKARADLLQLEKELNIKISDEDEDENDICETQYKPVLYGVYFMLSFIIQAMHPFEKNEELKEIWEKEACYREYFDFDIEKTDFIQDIYKKVKKEREDVLFPLKKEVRTFSMGTDSFIESYDFFRVIDRLAFPLHLGYTRLLEEDESDFIISLMQHFNFLGWFMLLRFGSRKTIEKMVTRKLLLKIDPKAVFSYVYSAVSRNLEFVQNQPERMEGNAYGHTIINGLEILKRLASIVGIPEQKKLLSLMCNLIEHNTVNEFGMLSEWTKQVMSVIDDRAKAAMLDELLRISVKKQPKEQPEKITDPFDVLYTHELSEKLFKNADIDADSIDFMLDEIEKENKEKRVYFSRLGQLYEWKLLSDEQIERMAKLLWKDVKDGDVPYYGEYYSFVILNWPYPENVDSAERIRHKLLDEQNFAQLRERELSSITYNTYLIDIRELNKHISDFWSIDQIELFVNEFIEYWKSLMQKEQKSKGCKIHREEFVSRTRDMIKTIASFNDEKLRKIEPQLMTRLRNMLEEISSYEIVGMELEVQVAEKEQISLVVKKIMNGLKSADEKTVISAMNATEYFLKRQSDSDYTKILWDFLVDLCRYRKEPGLGGVLTVLHNLLYTNQNCLSEETLLSLNDALNDVIRGTDYERYMDKTERELRQAIEIRESCANLAYQLYLYEQKNQVEFSPAVLDWKDICRGKKSIYEFSEVRRCWLQDFQE